MSEVNTREEALKVFNQIIDHFKARGVEHINVDEKDLTIDATFDGKDIPMRIILTVNDLHQLVTLISHMPFEVKEDKRIDLALAVAEANLGKPYGFDYDVKNGRIVYKASNSFRGTGISDETLEYMMVLALTMIDRYNDKFLSVATDNMTLAQFLEWNE